MSEKRTSRLIRHHTVKHASNGQRSKGRHEHTMGNRPVFLPGEIGREQPIVNAVSNLIQPRRDDLGESLFVTDLIDEFVRADEYSGPAKRCQSVDGALCVLAGGESGKFSNDDVPY